MNNTILKAGLKLSSAALLALTIGLSACGGGGNDVGAAVNSAESLPVFSGVTSCLTQTGVTTALQTQLGSVLTPALLTGGGTGAAGLTSVLSSFLNVSNLLTSGLQNLNGGGSTSAFAASLAGATDSLQCSVELLSNTLSAALTSAGSAGSGAAQITDVANAITALVPTLSTLSSQLASGGGSVDLTMLTSELSALSAALPGLSSLLSAVPGQGASLTTLLPYVSTGFANLSSIFSQLGELNGAGLTAALPMLLSDLTGLFSTATISQLGLPASLGSTLTTTLNQVLGNQTTILSGLTALLGATGLTGLLSGLLHL